MVNNYVCFAFLSILGVEVNILFYISPRHALCTWCFPQPSWLRFRWGVREGQPACQFPFSKYTWTLCFPFPSHLRSLHTARCFRPYNCSPVFHFHLLQLSQHRAQHPFSCRWRGPTSPMCCTHPAAVVSRKESAARTKRPSIAFTGCGRWVGVLRNASKFCQLTSKRHSIPVLWGRRLRKKGTPFQPHSNPIPPTTFFCVAPVGLPLHQERHMHPKDVVQLRGPRVWDAGA